MAITSSAKKALRNSKRRRVFNTRRVKKFEDAIRKVKKSVVEKKKAEALKFLSEAYKQIDKVAKANTWSKGTASRKKSRLAALVNKIA